MSNIKLALAIRGHIRDSFTNNRIKHFCEFLCKTYDIDIYIHTWNYFETGNSHRVGELSKKLQKKKVEEK